MKNSRVAIFEVEQSVDSLNAALASKNLSAEDVISIHDIAAGTMQIDAQNQAKYRVFYRN